MRITLNTIDHHEDLIISNYTGLNPTSHYIAGISQDGELLDLEISDSETDEIISFLKITVTELKELILKNT